jgi:dienelactone hydrolase
MKEQIFSADTARSFLARGISLLIVDQPGTGTAIRLNGLHVIYDSERWAGACVDYLERRNDVDQRRVGIFGLSFGGYHAPRAAAFEKRFALCAVLGANHNWGDLQRRRLSREGENPVPHYWDHVMWVFGKPDMESFMAYMPNVTLNGVVEKITVPFLVTHGSGDRQIPVSDAHQSFEQATASPKRELRIFEKRDMEVEHCGADNGTVGADFIADWTAETFADMKH